jgi:hypothetical protein
MAPDDLADDSGTRFWCAHLVQDTVLQWFFEALNICTTDLEIVVTGSMDLTG